MKLKEIKEKIEKITKEYPESLDWDVYIEDEDLYTIGSKVLNYNNYPQDMIEQNRKTIKKVKSESSNGWKFLKLNDFMAENGEDDAFVYYKDCAGGLGVVPDKKAITIHINL